MDIITRKDLSLVFEKKLNLPQKKAEDYASIVTDYFGFDDCIIDNLLDQNDRQIFYMLQEKGILTTAKMETALYDGRPWRIYYWHLNRRMIFMYLQEIDQGVPIIPNGKDIPKRSDHETIYNSLSDELWYTRKTIDT